MKLKLIASDLDGTLLNDQKQMPKENLTALKLAAEQGALFVIATGRTFHSIPEELLMLPGLGYIITSNGAAVYSVEDKKSIYHKYLNADTALEIAQLPLPERIAMEVFVKGIPYAPVLYIENPEYFGATAYGIPYVQKTRQPVNDLAAFINENSAHIDGIAFSCGSVQAKENCLKLLKHLDDIYITASLPHLIEIGHSQAGKGHTLQWLLQYLGIEADEAAVFGDADNDCDMLSSVYYSFSMENGTTACKDAAAYITASNNQGGVGKALISLMQMK